MARACSPPKTQRVKGYYRTVSGGRRRRKRSAPRGPYWVADDGRHTCGHRHRTLSGAHNCAKRHNKQERARRGRLTRAQARRTKTVIWIAKRKGG